MSINDKELINLLKKFPDENPNPVIRISKDGILEYFNTPSKDIIKYYGGEAANFMDVAGAATPERVAAAFKLIYRDSDVKGILINIFGGMMRCNDIAEGLVNASKEVGLNKPLVVRLEGTNVEMGMEILKNSGFPIKPVETMEEAAQKVVELVKK